MLAWVVLLVLALPFAGRAQSKLSNGGFEVPGAESERNLAYFEHLPRYGAQPFTLLVSAPTAEAAAARLADVHREALAVDDRIRFTTAPTASADGRTRAVTGYASVSQNEALAISRRLADRVQVTDGPTRVYVLGAPALYASFQRIIESDLARAETLTAPFIAIVLIALFGALVAATLPLALAIASVVITFGAVFFVASATEMSVFVTTMVSMIGIGVAVDYSMFVLARFREELEAGAYARRRRRHGDAHVGHRRRLLGPHGRAGAAGPVARAGAGRPVDGGGGDDGGDRRRPGVVDPAPRAPAPARAPGRPWPDPPPRRDGARPARRVLDPLGRADHAPPARLVLRVGGTADRAHAARDRARDRQPHARADAPVVTDRGGERHPLVADHRAGAGRGRGDLDPRPPALGRRVRAGARRAPSGGGGRARPAGPGHHDPAAWKRAQHPGPDPRRPGVGAGREHDRPAASAGGPCRPDRAGGDRRRWRRVGVQLRPEPGGRLRPVDGHRGRHRARVRWCCWCSCARCSCR